VITYLFPKYRNIALLAKQAVTFQEMSQGRLAFRTGAGATSQYASQSWHPFGIDYPTIKERLDNSVYDASLGTDCVKYAASSTLERIPTDNGEMRIDAIQGYLCLHPNLDNFGVLMQTSTFATVWTDIPRKENQSSFFQSMRFLPIFSSVSRNFTKKRTPGEHT
jgi:hypothetical protein